ncbi:MAG: transglycosylase SLT domain-containing protein [Bdellovibrionales bacterium]|nr:transglycosylase SLT domain-containing protein [Bdellovibrionales bacterium]
MNLRSLVVVLAILSFYPSAWSKLDIKEFKLADNLPKAPDLSAVKNPKNLSLMAKIKWFQKKSQWRQCVDNIEKAKHNSDIALWVNVVHLKCLRSWFQSRDKTPVNRLISSFRMIEGAKDIILSSPYDEFHELLQETFLDIANFALSKDRSQLDVFLNRNHDLVDRMQEEERGRYYEILGELAWLRQKNELATKNYVRSYSFFKDPGVYKKLKELNALGLLKLDKYKQEELHTEAEEKAWGKFQSASKKGQTINIARYGIDFLENFPGSGRASDVEDKISRTFKRLLYRRGQKYVSLKKEFIGELEEAPPSYIYFWADVAFQRGYYDSSLPLAQKAAKKWKDDKDAAGALIIAGRSAYYQADWSVAEEALNQLMDRFSGTEAANEAHYLLGLLFYRNQSYKKVITHYEKFLQSSGSDLWELQVRYWLWRALKIEKLSRASEQADAILKSFPLTYYGLLVLMETKGDMQQLFGKKVKKLTSEYWWSDHSLQRWKRIRKLVGFGWFEEVEREVDQLPAPQLGVDFFLRARLWDHIGLYRRAMMDYSEAVDKDLTFLTKEFMELAFPLKYKSHVERSSKKFSMDSDLVLAIIRQESAFVRDAVSPSNAMGLMQLLRNTAKETARWLRHKNYRSDDIFDPKTNIKFGSHFLSRMMKKYKGVVPLAVASYNVGPGNLDRWLNQRPDLKNWAEFGKNPVDDMWMDELPWGETSFYVKAILRNYLLYGILYSDLKTLSQPAWGNAQSLVTSDKAG